MYSEIIRPDEVIGALVDGYEVYCINGAAKDRYGVRCTPLTLVVYERIEEIMNSDENFIFVKTDRNMKEDSKDEE